MGYKKQLGTNVVVLRFEKPFNWIKWGLLFLALQKLDFT